MFSLAILASGSGTNAENIVRTFRDGSLLRVKLIITDHEDAGVIERMKPFGIKTIYIPGKVWRQEPQNIADILRGHGIDLVVLAGFMRLVAQPIVEAFPHRIINIHPALLPAYGGKGMWGHHVHEAVIAAGEKRSGVTVHYVDTQYDHGQIIMQDYVDIFPEDTAETLEAKIHQVEYSLYPRAIVEVLRRLTPPPMPPKGPIDLEKHEPAAPVPPPLPDNAPEASVDEEQPREEVVIDTETPAEQPRDIDEQWADALQIKNYSPATPPPLPAHPEPAYSPNAGAPGNGAPGNGGEAPTEPMPDNYFVLSIVVTLLCCFIPGIIAVLFSSRVSNLYYQGNIEASRRASRNAQIWIIVSFCLGVLSATLYLPYLIVANALGLG